MTVRALTYQNARAAAWATQSLIRARRQLRLSGLRRLELPPPPRLQPSARRGVDAVLRRVPNTCLERALVLQRWHLAQGREVDVIVGVAGSTATFGAHAWLDGESPDADRPYAEIHRISP